MKKSIFFLAMLAIAAISANAQGVTQKNIPATPNAMAKWYNGTQLTSSSLREPSVGTFSTSTGTMTLNGVITAQPTSTTSTGTALQAVGSGTAAPVRFKVRNDGAIFTGTLQGVASRTYAAASGATTVIVTVTNGLITSVE